MEAWLNSLVPQATKELVPWMCSRLRLDRQDAEELLAEAFYRLITEVAESKRRPDSPIAWLRTVAFNLYRDDYRREQRRQEVPLTTEDNHLSAELAAYESPFPTPEQMVGNEQLRICVKRALDRFAAESKEGRKMTLALRLIALDGLSREELAERLGRASANAVGVYLNTCRQQIRPYVRPCLDLIVSTR